MSKKQTPESIKPRVVRVFVSSTFRDMFAEREKLVKFTFPELRKKCRERGVEFVDVDLRWGVTDEQKAEGKVLPICLAEIERCRPYFIGLLGERYGWVPEEIDEELLEDQKWLKKHKEKSVTELEIIHGVLENPEMEKLSFFYFRDPETSKEIETKLSKEKDYAPEKDKSLYKLKKLKEKILEHEKNYPVPVRMDYPDSKTLGQQVLDDLWTAIDKRFPKEEVPSALERERIDHEAFAEARRKVYIGRDEYFRRLDEHVNSEGPPLVILGESGSGKSALISNWVARYRQDNPDEFIITHFIGGTPDSADYVRMLRRIMEEIQERYEPKSKDAEPRLPHFEKGGMGGFSDEIPTDPKKVIEAFPIWIAKASARGKLILILDALNQLEDKDNAPELGWLLEYFPPNVRVILSTLPGKSLDALNRRNLPSINVGLLDLEEKKTLIPQYLQRFSRSLSPSHLYLITDAEHTNNPLYLKALLDELRYYGDHLTLEERIKYYLEARTIDDLYERIFARYEEDYERDSPGLVRDAMSLIWASRRGLSETELLGMLGSKDKPLPKAVWSPLYLAAEESLISRSGLLNFAHDFLRKAVEEKYMVNKETSNDYHLKIADYFEDEALTGRKVDEMPWQFREAESWEKLKDSITKTGMFINLSSESKQYELMNYWLKLEDRFNIVEAHNEMIITYEKSVTDEQELSYLLNQTALFLDLNARYEGAEPLYRRALEIYEKRLGREHPSTATSMNNLAALLDSKGDYEGAEPLYRQALEIREKALGWEHPSTATSLNNLV